MLLFRILSYLNVNLQIPVLALVGCRALNVLPEHGPEQASRSLVDARPQKRQ